MGSSVRWRPDTRQKTAADALHSISCSLCLRLLGVRFLAMFSEGILGFLGNGSGEATMQTDLTEGFALGFWPCAHRTALFGPGHLCGFISPRSILKRLSDGYQLRSSCLEYVQLCFLGLPLGRLGSGVCKTSQRFGLAKMSGYPS